MGYFNVADDLKHRIALNTGVKYIALLSGMAITFFLTPFLIRMLGPELLGLQTLSGQALGFVGLISGALGVSYRRHATVSFARGDYESMNMYLSIGFWVSFLSALIFLIFTVVVAWWADKLFGLPNSLLPEARIVIAITGTATAFHIVAGVFESPSFIRQKFYIPDLATIASTLISALGVWYAFSVYKPSIIVWVLLTNGCRLATMLIISLPWCKKVLPEMKALMLPKGGKKEFISLFQFGGLSFIGGLGYLLFYSIDSIMISNLSELGIGKVVYYNVGQRWDPMVRMVIGAFVMTLTPALISRYSCGDFFGMRRILLKGTRFSLIIGVLPCILLTVFAHPFLKLWVGEAFAVESAPVMQLIMSSMVVSIPGILGYEALVATGRLGWAVGSTVLGGFLNVVLSISLVKFFDFGLLGIAIGTVSMLTLKNGLLTPYLVARYTEMPLTVYFKESYLLPLFTAAIFIPIVVVIRYWTNPDSLVRLFLILGGCSFIYMLLAWLIALEIDERAGIISRVISLLNSRRNKHRKE